MSDKDGHSEEKEDIFGNKYHQHYDADGRPSGRSEEKEGFFGDKYTQHYDADGNKSGTSKPEEGLLGGSYTQHRDDSGNKSGWTETKQGFFGDDYRQSYDESGEKTGWSEEKKGLFGKYTQRYSNRSGRAAEREAGSGGGGGTGGSYSGGSSGGGGGSGSGGPGIIIFLVFACAICSALKQAWDDWGKPPEYPDWEVAAETVSAARQELQKAIWDSSQPGKQLARFGVCAKGVFKEKYEVTIFEGLITWTEPGSTIFPGTSGRIHIRDIAEVKTGSDEYDVTPEPGAAHYMKTAEIKATPFGEEEWGSFVFPRSSDRDQFIAQVVSAKKAIEKKYPQLFALRVVAEPAKWSDRVFVYGCPWDYTVSNPQGTLKVAGENRHSDIYKPGQPTHLNAFAWIRFKSLDTRPLEVVVSRFPRLKSNRQSDVSKQSRGQDQADSLATAARNNPKEKGVERRSFVEPSSRPPSPLFRMESSQATDSRAISEATQKNQLISRPAQDVHFKGSSIARSTPAPPEVGRLALPENTSIAPVQPRPSVSRYTGKGSVYKVPELKSLIGKRLNNAWLEGDFVFKSAEGNTARFVTVGLFLFAKEGSTDVFIEYPGGIELSPRALRPSSQTGMVSTKSYAMPNPLQLISVSKQPGGRLLVKARASGMLRL